MPLTMQPRQVQSQTATPVMMMEMSLLGLPINELRDAVKKELDSNPALEETNVYGKIVPTGGVPRLSGTGDKEGFLENIADRRTESLDEHLMSELRMSGLSGRDLELCRAIIAELDEDGRFRGEMPSIQMVTGATERELESARRRIMAIDPKGCAAKDLEECFLAQAGIVPEGERAAFVRDLANLKTGRVSARTVEWLRKMDGFPGRRFDHRIADYVTPDVIVDKNGEVLVDQRDVPELRVSAKYVEMAKDATIDEETRRFAAERVKRAREFREAVKRRMDTMEKIAELAIGGQHGFLSKGISGLRRQTMREIALKAHCDVSTVSRAASRKYVKTPHGTLPLRRFFTLVDQAPIERLRAVLEASAGRLSDREVAEKMCAAGFPMARRTVAKYRARLGFPTKRPEILV